MAAKGNKWITSEPRLCQGPHQEISKVLEIQTSGKLVAYVGLHMN